MQYSCIALRYHESHIMQYVYISQTIEIIVVLQVCLAHFH